MRKIGKGRKRGTIYWNDSLLYKAQEGFIQEEFEFKIIRRLYNALQMKKGN